MVIVLHPPFSPELVAPCDFALFPKLKMKLKGQGNRKRYSTALRKMASTVFSKRGKNDGIALVRSQGDYFEGDGSQN
jgi:hypothetical protein